MKTELRFARHSVLLDQFVIELWYDDCFIGEITGADGPGIRIISKYAVRASSHERMLTEVRIYRDFEEWSSTTKEGG